jgi:predicted benzoate:H+ symporter BenE
VVAVVCIGRTSGHSGRTDVTMQPQAPAHLPRRYRTVMAALSLLAGVVAALLVFVQPATPSTFVALAAFLALGAGLGLAVFRALEHSLE